MIFDVSEIKEPAAIINTPMLFHTPNKVFIGLQNLIFKNSTKPAVKSDLFDF